MPPRKRVKKDPDVPKKSPYKEFTDWLFDGTDTTVLSESTIKALNPAMILQMFSLSEKITMYLNKNFNNYEIYTMDREKLFGFLKHIVQKRKIKRSELCYFQHFKEDKDIKNLWTKFPYLKRNEISMLIESMDEDESETLLEMTGIKTVKKERIKKHKEVKKEKKIKEDKPNNKITMDSWKDELLGVK